MTIHDMRIQSIADSLKTIALALAKPDDMELNIHDQLERIADTLAAIRVDQRHKR